jgi:hypothetical protein
LLGIKKVYTGAELQKPFVCVRITYQPDYDDPEVKRLITMASLGSMATVYGLPAPQQQLPAPEAYQTVADQDGDTEDGETIDMEPNGVSEEEPPREDDDLPDDFDNWDRASREKLVKKLAKEKAYDLKGLLSRMSKIKTLADFSDIQLLNLKDKLVGLPDPKEDDIPF